MRYTVENEFLRVEVDTLGAELASVVDKASGAQMLWQGDPAVWPRRAPILPLLRQAGRRQLHGGGQNLRRRPARLCPRPGA